MRNSKKAYLRTPHVAGLIALANSERLPVAASGADLVPGEIYALANDSRFSEAYFSQPLTTFAVGYRDPNDLFATLESIAPKVIAPGRLFEWKKWSNAEEFYSETDDVRAIGADFKRVEFTGQDQTGKTLNKGLTMRVDLDAVPRVGNTPIPGWENAYVAKLMRRLGRNELRRTMSLLSAAANNTAKTWDVNADPDQDVITEASAAADVQGFQFNRILYGHTAWVKRSLALRGNANAAKWASAACSKADLAELFGVDQVAVSKERYQSSAAAKSQVLGNLVLMYTAESGQSVEDPSNIKRFVTPATQYAGESGSYDRPSGGLDVNVFIQQVSAKLVDITVEHYSQSLVTSTVGIRQFTVS